MHLVISLTNAQVANLISFAGLVVLVIGEFRRR
jgi:hypothetical protein